MKREKVSEKGEKKCETEREKKTRERNGFSIILKTNQLFSFSFFWKKNKANQDIV